jgi:hypothetical protein
MINMLAAMSSCGVYVALNLELDVQNWTCPLTQPLGHSSREPLAGRRSTALITGRHWTSPALPEQLHLSLHALFAEERYQPANTSLVLVEPLCVRVGHIGSAVNSGISETLRLFGEG